MRILLNITNQPQKTAIRSVWPKNYVGSKGDNSYFEEVKKFYDRSGLDFGFDPDNQNILEEEKNNAWREASNDNNRVQVTKLPKYLTTSLESNQTRLNSKSNEINSDPASGEYSINPNTFDPIDNPDDYYGPRNGKSSGLGGFDFGRAKRFDIADSELPNDSKILDFLPGPVLQPAKNLWNEIRRNLVAGPDGKGLFANDEYLNKALNETIEKFLSNPNAHKEFQNALRNNDVMSLATAFRLSKEGINENGLGKLFESYARIDSSLPDEIVNAAYLGKFKSVLAQNGGDIIAAMEAAKKFDNKTYGELDLTSDQVKNFAQIVNYAAMESMAKALNIDPQLIEQTLKEKGGISSKEEFYNISGPMALASGLDFRLLEKGPDGKTGFQRLVEMSKPRADGKNHEAQVNFHIRPQANADGTAFLDFSQNGIEALAALQKHVGGLTDNPMLANQFSFVFKDEQNFKQWSPLILQEMKRAGIDVTKVNFNVEGHGDGNDAMVKSGVVGRDYQGIGKDDASFFTGLLEHLTALREVNFNFDSCKGFHPAKFIAEAFNQMAQSRGMNIATRFEGSVMDGLVRCFTGGEHNNQDRFVRNGDGTFSADAQRKDGGGTDQNGILFSKGEYEYNQAMQQIRDLRVKNPDKIN